MMRACGSDEANKLFEHIKSVLEIPSNATSIELRIAVDEVVTVKCTYAPNFKNVPKLCQPVAD